MPTVQVQLNGADTAWVMVSTALVLLMTPALGLFYGGLVRSKNVLNTMMMSMAAIGVVGLAWMLLGYSLAFSHGSPLVGGLDHAVLRDVGLEPGKWGPFPHVLYISYQGTFAIIAAALISGAVVERMRFGAFLAFLALWSLLVYAPVAHWVWGDGWIARMGAIDFAGGTVVHVNAGVAALVAAMTVGQRSDYGRHAVLPHNVPYVLLGAALLWFGWFGFNAGSALGANATTALAFVNTLVAPMGTLFVWLLLDLRRTGKATAVGAATAMVIGLVAITPGAGYVSPLSAIAIGAIAALPSYVALQMRSRSALDDSLDVFAAHGVGGIVGALLTGVFASKVWSAPVDGLLAGGGALVGRQLVALLATAAYSGVMTFLILRAVAVVLPLRRPFAQERLGLDVLQHGEEAYSHGDGALMVMRERRKIPRAPGDGKP